LQVKPYYHNTVRESLEYYGGVYSEEEDRGYFVPSQAITDTDSSDSPPVTIWQYVDCQTSTIQSYPALDLTYYSPQGNYRRGVYSPLQNRVYFSPHDQGLDSIWHYVTNATGVTYYHGTRISTGAAYEGGAYSPTLNRIYFAPYLQSLYPEWHYI